MNYCGVLNLDKPAGLTSRDVVNQVVRLVHPAKAGHAGTLDPLATGVLVVCIGHATRLINVVQEGRKRYFARFVLGQHSDTDDITGSITEGGNYRGITESQIAAILPEFIGRISQVPPRFSAVHVQGRRAYDLARRGQTFELKSRLVDVFSLRLMQFKAPEFELDIQCGSGTYIRSIGRDLGTRLGCGVVMSQLRRLSVGEFNTVDAIPPDTLTENSLSELLQPALKLVADWPRRLLTDGEANAVRRGQSISANDESSDMMITGTRIALVDQQRQLLGVAEFDSTTRRLHPRIVFPIDTNG